MIKIFRKSNKRIAFQLSRGKKEQKREEIQATRSPAIPDRDSRVPRTQIWVQENWSSRLLNISTFEPSPLQLFDIESSPILQWLTHHTNRKTPCIDSPLTSTVAMVAQSAKLKQAATDSKKLKAKPTDDELLEVRCLFVSKGLRPLLAFGIPSLPSSSDELADTICSYTPCIKWVPRRPSSRMLLSQELLTSRLVVSIH